MKNKNTIQKTVLVGQNAPFFIPPNAARRYFQPAWKADKGLLYQLSSLEH